MAVVLSSSCDMIEVSSKFNISAVSASFHPSARFSSTILISKVLLPPANEVAEGNVFTGVSVKRGEGGRVSLVPCPFRVGRLSGGGRVPPATSTQYASYSNAVLFAIDILLIRYCRSVTVSKHSMTRLEMTSAIQMRRSRKHASE